MACWPTASRPPRWGPTASTTSARAPVRPRASYIDWLTIADNEQSVVDDVSRIRAHPLVPGSIPVYGYIYDVATGRLVEVPEATKAGLPV